MKTNKIIFTSLLLVSFTALFSIYTVSAMWYWNYNKTERAELREDYKMKKTEMKDMYMSGERHMMGTWECINNMFFYTNDELQSYIDDFSWTIVTLLDEHSEDFIAEMELLKTEKREEMQEKLEELKEEYKEEMEENDDEDEKYEKMKEYKEEMQEIIDEHKEEMMEEKEEMLEEFLDWVYDIVWDLSEWEEYYAKLKEALEEKKDCNKKMYYSKKEYKEKNTKEYKKEYKEKRKSLNSEYKVEREELRKKYKKSFQKRVENKLEKISEAKLEKIIVKIWDIIEKVENNSNYTEEQKDILISQLMALSDLVNEELWNKDLKIDIDEILE